MKNNIEKLFDTSDEVTPENITEVVKSIAEEIEATQAVLILSNEEGTIAYRTMGIGALEGIGLMEQIKVNVVLG